MKRNKDIYESVAEYLDNKLGREATDKEIKKQIEAFEAEYYDTKEAEMKGN